MLRRSVNTKRKASVVVDLSVLLIHLLYTLHPQRPRGSQSRVGARPRLTAPGSPRISIMERNSTECKRNLKRTAMPLYMTPEIVSIPGGES